MVVVVGDRGEAVVCVFVSWGEVTAVCKISSAIEERRFSVGEEGG